MPNWCEGSLRLRGKPEEICKFIENQFKAYIYNPNEDKHTLETIEYTVKEWLINKSDLDKEYISYNIVLPPGGWVHINDTCRAFLGDDCYNIGCDNEYDGQMVVSIPIKQAWCYREDDWLAIFEQYDLDMRLFGYECGMGFEQRFTFIRGKEPVFETWEHEDWYFDCACPELGG